MQAAINDPNPTDSFSKKTDYFRSDIKIIEIIGFYLIFYCGTLDNYTHMFIIIKLILNIIKYIQHEIKKIEV